MWNAATNFARSGRLAQAQAFLKRIEAPLPDTDRANPNPFLLGVRAEVAYAEGRPADALRDWKLSMQKRRCQACYAEQLAAAFERMGQPDSAIKYLEWAQADSGFGSMPSASRAEHLGRLYEKKGDNAKAVAAYSQVVELWKGADAVLQPKVKAARDRITALKR